MSPAKEALAKIRELKQKLAEAEKGSNEPIAIVSTACRFPRSSDSPEKFWASLINKSNEVSEVPPERWDTEAFFDKDPDAPGKMYTLRGAFLDRIDAMDADFFGISPREAAWVDPQQRLFLEVSWEAIERAGWASDRLETDTGVFVGWMHNDYQNTATDVLRDLNPYIATGSAGSFLSGRLSYFLGIQGPSLALDTACSSSLVALHLACQSLRQKECSRALAGGVNVMVSPKTTVMTCKLQALSPHGYSRAFDASADGYLRGEGCGVIALRRLSDAQKDGENILAVIRGSAVSHNGFSSGLTAPNPDSQKTVIRKALSRAGLSPEDIDYLEAHGTGTELGDPIELNAAADVLGRGRDKSNPLLVGSVKTNIGHLEAAAGIAGVIKTVLAIQNQNIPAHLHFETPNPHIAWDREPVEIVTEARAWPDKNSQIAGISAFGMSGTNAHLILQSPPQPVPCALPQRTRYTPRLLTLSGKSEDALIDLADRYRKFLSCHPEISLSDIVWSAAVHRRHFENRAAIVGNSREDIEKKLLTIADRKETAGVFSGPTRANPVVAWQFTGQGSQYAGMGKKLYETEPVFRHWMDNCSKELSKYRSGDLYQIISEDEDRLSETIWTQPALFSIHLCLAELMKSRGFHPDIVLGHSLGQYAAACIAEMLDWKDGIRLIHERSRLTGSLPCEGAMLAVFSSAKVVEAIIKRHPGLSIAARNGSNNVISGLKETVATAEKDLLEQQIRTRRLLTSQAFHSTLLDPVLDEFETVADSISFRAGTIPLICNISGHALPADFIPNGAYWRTQLRQTVQYSKSIGNLKEYGCNILVELGPQPVLTRIAAASWSGEPSSLIPTLNREHDDSVCLHEATAKLYQQGINPDFESLFSAKEAHNFVSIPTYPFQRKKFWGPQKPGLVQSGDKTGHPILGDERSLAGVQNEKRFESQISSERQRWLTDHKVFNDIIFPGAGYVEMLVSATESGAQVENIAFEMPLMIQGVVTMQTIVKPDSLEIYSKAGEASQWVRNVSATSSRESQTLSATINREDIERICAESGDIKTFYEMFSAIGIHYGSEFQTIKSLRYSKTDVLAKLELNGQHSGFRLSPMLLDGAFQSLAVGLLSDPDSSLFLPVGIGRYQNTGTPTKDTVWCHGKWNETQGDERTADLTLFDDEGRIVALVGSLKVRSVSRSALRQIVGSSTGRLLYSVVWKPDKFSIPNPAKSHIMVVGDHPVAKELQQRGHTVSQVSVAGAVMKLDASIGGIVWVIGKSPEIRIHTEGILAVLNGLKEKKIESLNRGFQIVTCAAVPARAGDTINPDSAQFWGLGRVINNEYPTLQSRLIDCSEAEVISLADALLSDSTETQIALRSGQVLIPRLVPAKAPFSSAGVPVMSKATYLITGGLGNLGLRAAEWLSERGAGNIVLVSRRPPVPAAKELISQIAGSGCRVHVMLADISSRSSLETLLKGMTSDLPPLRGIIHAAGLLDDGLLVDQTWAKFEKVLAPKRIGASLLHELTIDNPIDFFILYSSAASILGSPGQANYAMANAYLDGLAQKRASEGLPGMSVNFGPWNEGMAATEKVKKALEMQGLNPLTAEEAHEVIDRMLDNRLIQATVLDADWGQMRSRFPTAPPAILNELWPEEPKNSPRDSALLKKLHVNEDNNARVRIFQEHIEQELQQVLSLSGPPGKEIPLAELGLDSLMAVEFATRLQRQVGNTFAIPPTLAFDYPTVSKLTEFLSGLIDQIPVSEIASASVSLSKSDRDESVAVVGLGCRFPGADGIDAYWDVLRNGVDATCEIPADRWDMDQLYDLFPTPGKIYTKRGGFLPDIAEFDAQFFGISDQDAAWMDPQHRMMLEVSWHTLQSAGIDPENVSDPQVGVFMGIMSTDYAQLREKLNPSDIIGAQGAGLSHSAGVGRINYMLGFEGPAIAIDTASSSSLVAVSNAVSSLLNKECNFALAGGVNAILSPVNSLLLCRGKVLSPDGRCKSFSAAADGFGRGEGCGMVALKRLNDAERDRDNILAIIRGTSISHNGKNAGLTAPGGKSQQQMLERAIKNSGLQPSDIQYLEAHATGTELGDPIEVIAAEKVYGKGRPGENKLLLGSAKANLGHLEAAGGISGLIKVIMAMKNQIIPVQINFNEPSQHIPWNRISAAVVTKEREWPNPNRLLAGVSALGMTGTNAHIVVEGGSDTELNSSDLHLFQRKRYWF